MQAAGYCVRVYQLSFRIFLQFSYIYLQGFLSVQDKVNRSCLQGRLHLPSSVQQEVQVQGLTHSHLL